MKKKVVIAIVISVLVIAAIVFGVLYFLKKGGSSTKGKLVYVESVRAVAGISVGNSSRFMGVVESQETKSVNKDSSKTVKEVYVKEGDVVKEGDKLFAYDTTDMELELEQLKLDRDSINNSIASYNTSLSDYKAQRDKATDEDDILSYTSQINSISSSIKEEEYNLSVKNLEIEKQEASIADNVVKAPMNGMIKKIKKDTGDDENESPDDNGGENDAYITIIAEGDYRVKATADEANIYSFTAGTSVVVRSRTDESQIWKGTVAKVDMEPTKDNNDYDDNNGESASKYSFYVNLETTDGLMMGQHLFVELDQGQAEVVEGLQIPSYYLVEEEDGNFYIWKQTEDKTIKKVMVKVGEYDEVRDTYPVTDGLTESDYIAFPDDEITDGCPTTSNYEEYEAAMEENMNSGENDDSGEVGDEMMEMGPDTDVISDDGPDAGGVDSVGPESDDTMDYVDGPDGDDTLDDDETFDEEE